MELLGAEPDKSVWYVGDTRYDMTHAAYLGCTGIWFTGCGEREAGDAMRTNEQKKQFLHGHINKDIQGLLAKRKDRDAIAPAEIYIRDSYRTLGQLLDAACKEHGK